MKQGARHFFLSGPKLKLFHRFKKKRETEEVDEATFYRRWSNMSRHPQNEAQCAGIHRLSFRNQNCGKKENEQVNR